jgi:hypothetical protein
MIDILLLEELIAAYNISYIGKNSNRQIINKPFVNDDNEFIAVPKTNSYFILEDCKDKKDVQIKMVKWLSRDCGKAQISPVAKKFNQQGFNNFCGTTFNTEEFIQIYNKLGNGVNHELALDFIDSEFDLEILDVLR